MEIYIPILNGNKVHNVAQSSRSRLQVAAMNNFSNFGVDRTVICRLETKRPATSLNEKYFPGPELEPAARLTDRIDVKVIPGHDPGPRQPADVPQAHGPRLSGP